MWDLCGEHQQSNLDIYEWFLLFLIFFISILQFLDADLWICYTPACMHNMKVVWFPIQFIRNTGGVKIVFLVAKATLAFTVSKPHILCHTPSANHSLSCVWLALIPSANQNELKTVHLYCQIISWLALILYTILIHDAINICFY